MQIYIPSILISILFYSIYLVILVAIWIWLANKAYNRLKSHNCEALTMLFVMMRRKDEAVISVLTNSIATLKKENRQDFIEQMKIIINKA